MIQKRIAAVLSSGVLALGLVACTGTSDTGSDKSSSPRHGGVLTAAIPNDPKTLDWGINTDLLTISLSQNIFELLFAPDKDFVVRPMLASGYDRSKDGKTYTIALRKDVTFQNGDTMTSKDVVASLNRYFEVSGAGQLTKKDVLSVTAPDQSTVAVKLREPRYSFIPDLATALQPAIIIPASIAKAAGNKTLTDEQTIGTGPYELDKFVHGQYVQFKAFKGYTSRTEDWGGLTGKKTAYIPKIIYRFVTDSTQRINGLSTNRWQYAQTLDIDSYDQIKKTPNVTPQVEKQSLVTYVLINSGEGLFKDVRARRALNFLIDKKAMAQASLGPEELWMPMSGQIAFPDNKPMYSDAGMDIYKAHDPEKAKQLFAEAGITSSTPISILTTRTYPQFYQVAVVLQSELKSIGITANLKVYDFPTMISKLAEEPASWNLSMTSFFGEVLSPTQVLILSPTWPGGYKSKNMDAALEQYQRALSPEEAKSAMDKIQGLVWEEMPDIGIAKFASLGATTNSVKDYESFIGAGFWNTYLKN